jgi:hypothetical protein
MCILAFCSIIGMLCGKGLQTFRGNRTKELHKAGLKEKNLARAQASAANMQVQLSNKDSKLYKEISKKIVYALDPQSDSD